MIPFLLTIQHRQHKWAICRYFKPSSGLEPETPSLPCDFGGNRWQQVAKRLAW